MGELTYVLDDERVCRAIFAEWNYFYGKPSAGLPHIENKWWTPVFQTLWALGLVELNTTDNMWYITTFAKERCIFALSNNDAVLTVRIPTED